jgi:thioredoxin reductase
VQPWEVIVVGGGPAGLSAALLLGRCRRRVLLVDDDQPRNGAAAQSHGFFTRDGAAPQELRRIGVEQLQRYEVAIVRTTIETGSRSARGFELHARDGRRFEARKLLLATGLTDVMPQVPGLRERWGRGVLTCPFCDGWELRERALAVLGADAQGTELALSLTTWSPDVVLCTHGRALNRKDQELLRAHGIAWRTEPIARVEGPAAQLERVVFTHGPPLARDALFVATETRQRSPLATALGCQLRDDAGVETARELVGADGVYVAGDAAHHGSFIAVAAAEGIKAAVAIHKELREERSRALLGALADRAAT